MPLCGGTSEAKPANAEAQAACDAVKGEVESRLNRKLDKFTAILMATQVVAGTNYFVKVQLADNEYAHLRIYKHFSGTTALHGVQHPKTKEEPLIYFQE